MPRRACSASYEGWERRPHVRAILQEVIRLGSVIQTTNRMQAWVRDQVLALQKRLGRLEIPDPNIIPPLLDGFLATPPGKRKARKGIAAKTRGYQLLQRAVTLPIGRVVPFDDALGPGFVLVAYDCNSFGSARSGSVGTLHSAWGTCGAGRAMPQRIFSARQRARPYG